MLFFHRSLRRLVAIELELVCSRLFHLLQQLENATLEWKSRTIGKEIFGFDHAFLHGEVMYPQIVALLLWLIIDINRGLCSIVMEKRGSGAQ